MTKMTDLHRMMLHNLVVAVCGFETSHCTLHFAAIIPLDGL